MRTCEIALFLGCLSRFGLWRAACTENALRDPSSHGELRPSRSLAMSLLARNPASSFHASSGGRTSFGFRPAFLRSGESSFSRDEDLVSTVEQHGALLRSPHPRMMPQQTPKVPYKWPGYQKPVMINVFSRLYRERIMFLNGGLNDDSANNIIAVMLQLESEDPKKLVQLYCNIPGADTKAGLAIYDTMGFMPYEIQTLNMGLCAGMGAFLAAAGTKGKRVALPNAQFVLTNPAMGGQGQMQATDIQLEVEEVLRSKKRVHDELSRLTGQPIEKIGEDLKREFWLSSEEAKEYGLIDSIALPNSGR